MAVLDTPSSRKRRISSSLPSSRETPSVPGDLLGVLQGPSVRQVRRDPRRPERVAARRGREPRRRRPPLDHGQHHPSRQRPPTQSLPHPVHALLRLVFCCSKSDPRGVEPTDWSCSDERRASRRCCRAAAPGPVGQPGPVLFLEGAVRRQRRLGRPQMQRCPHLRQHPRVYGVGLGALSHRLRNVPCCRTVRPERAFVPDRTVPVSDPDGLPSPG